MVLNKWVIGIEPNKCQDQFRVCDNSFESSPKNLFKLFKSELVKVTCDTQYYMQYKVMGVVFFNDDGPCFNIQHTIKNVTLSIDTFHSDSLKHTCLESYSPRIFEAVF